MDEVVAISNGISFIPNFIKICQLVKNLREEHFRQHGDIIGLISSLRKQRGLKVLLKSC